MSETNIPKARLLTIREVLGVDSLDEFGFGQTTSIDDAKILEELSDKKEEKLSIFKTRGILCETVIAPGYRLYDPIKTKTGAYIIYPSGYRMKNDYQDIDRVRHLYIESRGNVSPDLDAQNSCVRVAFTWSEIRQYCQNYHVAEDGVAEAEYGLWPIVDKLHYLPQDLLEPLYAHQDKLHLLKTTPLQYTTDHKSYEKDAECKTHPVYELNGMYFARIEDNINGIGDRLWVQLQPLKLWIDEEKDVAVSAYTVCRIPRYDDTETYLENYFSKEIFDGNILLKGKDNISQNKNEAPPSQQAEEEQKKTTGKQIVKVRLVPKQDIKK